MSEKAPERIVAVSLRDANGMCVSMTAPARHHDVIHNMVVNLGYSRQEVAACEQGFTTSYGRWVSRMDALAIATEADQIVRGPSSPVHGLFSEDVW